MKEPTSPDPAPGRAASVQMVEPSIFVIRERTVMLDRAVAELYGVNAHASRVQAP